MAPLVLGPLMEQNFRQMLIAEQGNMLAFVEPPLLGTFIAIILVFFLLPLLKYVKKSSRARQTPLGSEK